MAWTLSSGNAILTVTGTETDLSNMPTSVTTVTTVGERTLYSLVSTTSIVVSGTLTINPEIETLITNSNARSVEVASGGTLNLGTEISKTLTDGTTDVRLSKGLALTSTVGQSAWFGTLSGNNTNAVGVLSGGSLNWLGATIGGHACVHFADASHGWIRDGVLDLIVPTTGAVPPTGRGSISWWETTDLRIDGFTIRQSGEVLFKENLTGTNTLSGTANGIFGYGSEQGGNPVFPQVDNFVISNSELANSGSTKDMVMQSESGPAGARVNTHTSVYNELGGTSLRCIASENSVDRRNFGTVEIYRQLDFDAKDGITEADITGGRWFIRDTNNGLRKNANTIDNTADKTYTGVFSAGGSTQTDVLLGVVNADKTAGNLDVNTTNDPANTDTVNAEWRMDKRTTSDVLGTDTMTIHNWIYDYNYLAQTDFNLTEGTTGVLTSSTRYTIDPSVTSSRAEAVTLAATLGTNFAYDSTELVISADTNLDDIYDVIKVRKEESALSMEVPSVSTLIVDSDTGVMDFGNLDIQITIGNPVAVGKTHTAVTHNSTISLDDFTLNELTVEATELTVTGSSLVVPAGCKLVGTLTKNTAFSLTADENSDLSELILAGTGTFTIEGLTGSDLDPSTTATVIERFTHTIQIDTASVSSDTYISVVYDGTKIDSVSEKVDGSVSSHTIDLVSTTHSLDIGRSLVVSVTAGDGNDVYHSTTAGGTVDNLTINGDPSYNNSSSSTIDTGVVASFDSVNSRLVITCNAGINLDGGSTNKTFGSLRSSQAYADYIAAVGSSVGSIAHGSTSSTTLKGRVSILDSFIHEIVTASVIDSEGNTVVAGPVFQGLVFTNDGDIALNSTPGTATSTDSTLTVAITPAVAPDVSVDYSAVQASVTTAIRTPLTRLGLGIPLNSNDF